MKEKWKKWSALFLCLMLTVSAPLEVLAVDSAPAEKTEASGEAAEPQAENKDSQKDGKEDVQSSQNSPADIAVLSDEDAQQEDEKTEETITQKRSRSVTARNASDQVLSITDTDQTERVYKVTLNYPGLSSMDDVLFAVWGEQNGQDDLRWYTSSTAGDGTYTYNVSISNHRQAGNYFVHAYARNQYGQMTFLKGENFHVTAPTAASITVENQSSEGDFQVRVSGIQSASGISRVQVPVWCAQDQSDIVWYQARMQSDGSWVAPVSVSNHHNNLGTYQCHVYVEGGNSISKFVGKTEQQVAGEIGDLTAADVSGKETQYKIQLNKTRIPGGFQEVKFAVWAEKNGQDDLIWYSASSDANSSYTYTVDIRNHRQTGQYAVHAYGFRANGSMTFLKGTTFHVSAAPKAQSISAENFDASAGRFRVRVSGIQAVSGINGVRIPVWQESDQNDIVWYQGTRQSDGSYIADVSISNHKDHLGVYQIHAYIDCGNGTSVFGGGTTQEVKGEIGDLAISNPDGKEMTYEIRLSGAQVSGGIHAVQFAVWGELNGQNDIHWYQANKNTDGSYSCRVSMRDHRELGQYSVHAYAILKNGSRKFLKPANFEVKSKPSASVSVSSGDKGSFRVTVSGIKALSGVESVQVPVWQSSDQNDIVWYQAVRQSNGDYVADGDFKNHKYNTGTYHVHVYVTMNNGIRAFTNGTTMNIAVSSYVDAVKLSDSQWKVTIVNPQGGNAVSRVQFPTWSEANGQDDIVWYEGSRSGNAWSATVDMNNHRDAGNFITHVYATVNGRAAYAGQTNFKMDMTAQAARVKRNVDAVIASATNASMDSGTKLRACYEWVVNNISYQTLPVPMAPENGYTSEQWYAIYGLETRRGNCYCYAAAFAAIARQLGYDARFISGSVPLLAGGYGPHGWVEIVMNGMTYVCDPEGQYEFGWGYGFYMTTYATAPLPYRK